MDKWWSGIGSTGDESSVPFSSPRFSITYPQGLFRALLPDPGLPFSAHSRHGAAMGRLHLHLISDSTGETLENIAKAAIAQFDDVEVVRHFWPMVRSESHLDRIMAEVQASPGMILFTLVNGELRVSLERRANALNLPTVAALDAVTDALSRMLGQEAKARPGRQHVLDAAYFARVEAIQFTVAHDDGIGWENWEQADIVLAGVSRTSKTPTSIYLANRGFKTANIPIVPESPPPNALFTLTTEDEARAVAPAGELHQT